MHGVLELSNCLLASKEDPKWCMGDLGLQICNSNFGCNLVDDLSRA